MARFTFEKLKQCMIKEIAYCKTNKELLKVIEEGWNYYKTESKKQKKRNNTKNKEYWRRENG